MVKEPVAGRVKTRLGRDIGMIRATWWFRHQSRQLIQRLSADRRWNTVLAVSPDIQGLTSRIWPAGTARVAQGGGDLGDRMARLLRSFRAGPVVIVGADIPAISPAHIASAFRALGNHQAVFGPAPDGGFWLVGLKRLGPPPRTLFQNVRWSSEFALADSIASLGDLNFAQIDQLRDIDTGADL